MNNLFDMMMEAQNGQAAETLARYFKLNRQQIEQAIEHMMPAFSNGLKRNTADPMALMNFMSALASGQHGKYHDDPTKAFQQEAISEGNAILGHLFGSKDMSRAVADQVALACGVGPETLKQMLPVIASMVMGGLFKGSVGNTGMPSSDGSMTGDLLGSFMNNMMKGSMPGFPPTQQQGQTTPNPITDNPFGKMMEDFLGGAAGQTKSKASSPPEPPSPPERGADIFGEMFESGRLVQEEYKKNLDSIFETYHDGVRKL